MNKKQFLIFAIVGLLLAFGSGRAWAQAASSSDTPTTKKTDTTKKSDLSKPAATAPAATTKSAGTTTSAAPPQKGMVWVNTDSGTYHMEGSRWYGKTKQGKYMTEADAKKAGYKPAKSASN